MILLSKIKRIKCLSLNEDNKMNNKKKYNNKEIIKIIKYK